MAQLTELEERLTAALDARARQIDESDLGAAGLPEPGHRSRGLVLLAAAACTALVIGVPYAVAQLDSSSEPNPPVTTAPPSPTASSTGTGEGADWPVVSVGRIDLDGDGNDETVRLKVQPANGLNPSGELAARVEVALPSGTVYAVLTQGTEYRLEGAADLPGSQGEELLVSVGTSLRVLDLVGGQLRVLDAPVEPPLVRRIDRQGRLVTWVVQKGELSTLRSIEPFEAGAVRFTAYRWRWFVADGELRTAPYESLCFDTQAPVDAFVTCGAPTTFTPSAMSTVSWNEVGVLAFPVGGERATAEVVLGGGPGRDSLASGDATLVVKAGGRTWSRPLDAGGLPVLVTDRVVTTAAGDSAVLVRRTTVPEREVWELFGWVGNDFVQLRSTETFAPGLIDGSIAEAIGAKPQRSWVQDGEIYTAIRPSDGGWDVYRWDQEETTVAPRLVADGICFTKAGIGTPC